MIHKVSLELYALEKPCIKLICPLALVLERQAHLQASHNSHRFHIRVNGILFY